MKNILSLIILFCITSCLSNQQEEQKEVNQYIGWWIYGEGQHIFKDESTSGEWFIDFVNEDPIELESLYLAIAETEYLPIECIMQATLNDDTLVVQDFEITYIQGCDENYLSE